MNSFNGIEARLVGVGGTNHSGKDTVGNHLAEQHGFMHVSISDVLRAEATRQGLDHSRPTLIEVYVRMREEHGQGAAILSAIEEWEKQRDTFLGGLVLSSVRVPAEGHEIKKQGGSLLFIDAPAELRYNRSRERIRGDETFTTFEDYVEQEQTELLGLGGPNRPHLRAIQEMADTTITNDGTLADYISAVDSALELPVH